VDVRPDPDGFDRLIVVVPEWDATFEVSGACPVQAFGTVRGRDLFFHARHGIWFFEVADSAGNMPSDGYRESDGFYLEGIDTYSGYVPLPEAVAVVAECLRTYTK
jgi:hypothetical protein